ncbi:hypothetical protein LTR78_006451 [Recurvomyces mirabilis]|uniref:Myb-like domain-containing protein n=1 Tax=Recurvomyces mirabilis TaxID=574656 RepID=A0AAE0WKS2_9PEZI|nr:hypothetical protein LTR78_006451 [Recurvomyces mirabilis]KAK5151129.1 hypothetical protein LTS14_009625 [Recurvomyces mirabilis]
MPNSPWTDAADRQLLLAIIHLTAPQLPKWDQVADLMGDGFTAESVRQHFQKLRKESKAELGDATGVAANEKGNLPTNSTPRKPKVAKDATPAKSTGKRKGMKNLGHDGDDDEDDASPSKKVKGEDAAENDVFN